MLGELIPIDRRSRRTRRQRVWCGIREEIEATTGRNCSIGALYTTIDRLEAKGPAKDVDGAATPSGVAAPSAWFV